MMADATKLLPCPFCGSPPYTDDETLRIFGKRTGHGYAVACRNCEATTGGDDDKFSAIAAWNTRAALAAANARADRAEAALAAQIEADARIVEALYRNALGESDADLESPWKSHKASAFGIAVGAIRAQPHDRAALEPAPRVSETPKSDHDRADVLSAIEPAPVTPAEAAKVLLADKAALATLVDVAEEEHDKGVSFGVVIGRALRAIGEGEANG